MPVKTPLRICLFAGDTCIAESFDISLWNRVLQELIQQERTTQRKTQNSQELPEVLRTLTEEEIKEAKIRSKEQMREAWRKVSEDSRSLRQQRGAQISALKSAEIRAALALSIASAEIPTASVAEIEAKAISLMSMDEAQLRAILQKSSFGVDDSEARSLEEEHGTNSESQHTAVVYESEQKEASGATEGDQGAPSEGV